MQTITNVLIAHGHSIFPHVLRRLLESHRSFRILDRAASTVELKKITAHLKADVIICRYCPARYEQLCRTVNSAPLYHKAFTT